MTGTAGRLVHCGSARNREIQADAVEFRQEYVRLPSEISLSHRKIHPMRQKALRGNRTAAEWKIVTL